MLAAIAARDGTLPLANGTSGVWRTELLTGALSFTWHNTDFSFGKQSLWLGPGEAGPLLLSSNAAPIPMLRIASAAPQRLPILSRWLGPAQTEFFLGQLSGHHWEFASPDLVGPNIRPQPFMHGEKISFQPTPNLEFGMGVTAMFAGPGLPFTWANFLRTYYVHTQDVARNPGKRTSSFDVRYRVPHLRKWLTVYLDSMVVDEFSPLGSDRPTLNPGIYLPQLPKLPHFDLRAEGLKEPLTTEFAPGFVYFDARRYRDGYTNGGQLLGSWIGRAGRGGQAWLTYWFSARDKVQLGYRHQEVARDFLEGGRLVDYSLRGETLASPKLAVSGALTYEQWRFPLLAAGRQSNVVASIQITWLPRWRAGGGPSRP